MKSTLKYALLMGVMAVSTAAHAQTVDATATTSTTVQTETVQERTVERQMIAPAVQQIEMLEFDADVDGAVTMDEIAMRLFKIYDTDGNGVIDNVEFRAKQLVTVVPVEREVTMMIDTNGDGIAEQSSYTQEVFLRETRLSMFDDNNDGLTAHEFIGQGYLETDTNRDNAIDENEWQAAYKVEFKAHDDSETFN